MDRNIAAVRGALVATMKPTPVSTLLNISGVQDRLFFCEYETCIQFFYDLYSNFVSFLHFHSICQNSELK